MAGGRLYFFTGCELWTSDGTPAGTSLLADLQPGAGSSALDLDPRSAFVDGHWYFRAKGGENTGTQLWATDGTAAGTRTLLSNPRTSGFRLNLLGQLAGPRAFFDLDGTLLFQGTDGATGAELWRSDGTPAGTTLVKDLQPGPASSLPAEITRAGSTVFFRSDAGTQHEKLWKTDGTPAGTVLLRSVEQFYNFGNFSPRDLTVLGNSLLFLGSCCNNSLPELIRSDGTAAGTQPVGTPPDSFFGHSIVTYLLAETVPGPGSKRLGPFATGTRMLQDIAPGDLPSSPAEFTASGLNVYFLANDGTTGVELWALPRTALLATFGDTPAAHWAWRFVEALAASGITAGCAADSTYCPAGPVTRAQAAVFLVRSSHGPAYLPPPATGTLFQDVPAGHWAARWIEQLAADGVAAGCGGGSYCPSRILTRAEMAVLLLRLFGLPLP